MAGVVARGIRGDKEAGVIIERLGKVLVLASDSLCKRTDSGGTGSMGENLGNGWDAKRSETHFPHFRMLVLATLSYFHFKTSGGAAAIVRRFSNTKRKEKLARARLATLRGVRLLDKTPHRCLNSCDIPERASSASNVYTVLRNGKGG